MATLNNHELQEQPEQVKSLSEMPSKRSGKSAKAYRLERDAALAKLDVEAQKDLLGSRLIDEEYIKKLQKQAKDDIDSLVFKATDTLIQQKRLILARLADGKFTLEFRL